MAPKNQGILSFDPVEARRRAVNLLTTPTTKGLGNFTLKKENQQQTKNFLMIEEFLQVAQ